MHFKKFATLLPLAAAAPLEKRLNLMSADDILVAQFAHYLENLEYNFYQGGCDKYSAADFVAAGLASEYHDNVCLTAKQEATHRDTLASLLTAAGQTPLPTCQYSFPYTSPGSFAALADLITTVGIGAYLGGADLIMKNQDLLTAAAAILSVEARHNSYLRSGDNAVPFPSPFDTALPALWAYNLAHSFITSCPTELPNPPFVLLPQLRLTSPYDSGAPPASNALQMPISAGKTLSFSWDPSKFFVAVDPNAPLYIAFVNQNAAPIFEQVTKTGSGSGTVPLPTALSNSAFAVLTTFSGGLNATQLAEFGTLAGPQEVLVS